MPSFPAHSSQDTQADFHSAAQSRPQIWRTLLGLFIIVLCFFGSTFAVIFGGSRLFQLTPQEIVAGSTPTAVALMFLTFIGAHVGLWITLRLLHKRRYPSLYGSANKLNWRQFRLGMLAAFSLLVIVSLLGFTAPAFVSLDEMPEPTANMAFQDWAIVILPVLLLIFLQSFAEELVFRGYLLQQLRARFKSFWIWAILPSAFFGVSHFDFATYGNNAYLYVLATTIFGAAMALITVKTGNIGAAAGIHFCNNAMMTLLGTKETLDGASLFITEIAPKGAYMSYSMILQSIVTLISLAIWWKVTQRKLLIAKVAQGD